jgi:enamine deaminase RidA (YjgF/YER057c/UK114 family)
MEDILLDTMFELPGMEQRDEEVVVNEEAGAARPAATMIVAGLMEPAMRIEIEVTARLP